MTPRLTFLGAARTVTGSKYLIEHAGRRLLVDCGLFQGPKALRLLNWEPLPVPAASIDAVVLTHAHLDHSGYLPRLINQGFAGRIYCSKATADLCGLLLPDSGYLQEEDAEYANRHGFSKHHPALPLYTAEDARRALGRFAARPGNENFDVAHGIRHGSRTRAICWVHARFPSTSDRARSSSAAISDVPTTH
jgi:metallo-beta-lactamase family protein